MLFDAIWPGHDEMDATSARIASTPDLPPTCMGRTSRGCASGCPRSISARASTLESRACIMEAAQQYQAHGGAAREGDAACPLRQYALPTYYIMSSAEASSNLARFDGVKYGYRAEHYDGLVDLYVKSPQRGLWRRGASAASCWAPLCSASGYYDAYYKRAQAHAASSISAGLCRGL